MYYLACRESPQLKRMYLLILRWTNRNYKWFILVKNVQKVVEIAIFPGCDVTPQSILLFRPESCFSSISCSQKEMPQWYALFPESLESNKYGCPTSSEIPKLNSLRFHLTSSTVKYNEYWLDTPCLHLPVWKSGIRGTFPFHQLARFFHQQAS